MRQFDVCRNIGKNRSDSPFYVVVQSSLFEDFSSRLVVPLLTRLAGETLYTPYFQVEGSTLMLASLLMFPIPRGRLGEVVLSLADDSSAMKIVTSIDGVISRAYQ